MIAWSAASALAAGTAGLEGGAVAAQGSAALDVDGALGAWVAVAPRPWGVAFELSAWHHVDGAKPYVEGTSLYRLSRAEGRAAAFAELALGTHATTFHAGIGPGLTLTSARMRSEGRDATAATWDPGIAGRIALDGPVVGALGWQWRCGLTTRGLEAVDYDTMLGVGVAW